MKKILIIAVLFVSCITARAQVHVSFNIGTQPVWGPTGYDYARYYYIPDIDAYYDVAAQMYVYQWGKGWRRSRTLPSRYSNVDLYSVHKVVINDPNPWMRHNQYHSQYWGYRGRHDQVAIRDSREEKYYENPHHPMHNEWHGHGYGGYNNRYNGNRYNDHDRDRDHNRYNNRYNNDRDNNNNNNYNNRYNNNRDNNNNNYNNGQNNYNNGQNNRSNWHDQRVDH
ncbi:MAG: hypothetical protein JSS82_18760 [Bacteroidetes bacterium]|nr:hypothetical protein [Bacteroidota bacterium]